MHDVQLVEELTGADVPPQTRQLRQELGGEPDGVAGAVRVAGPRRASAGEHGRANGADGLRGDGGLVREQHDHGLRDHGRAEQRADASGERARLTRRMVGVDHDLDVAVPGAVTGTGGHGIGVVPHDDQDPVHPGSPGGVDGVRDQGTAVQLRELLGARPEPTAVPRREDQRDDTGPAVLVGPRLLSVEEAHVDDHAATREEPAGRHAAVVTASDGVASGHRQDGSGDAVSAQLEAAGFTVVERVSVPDERATIAARLRELADGGTVALIAITGGTGFAPRDVTPEATADVVEREAPGLAEAMRAVGRASTPMADLSRGICGIRGATLLVDLPGSPRGATESLAAVLELLPHALDLLAGATRHHPDGHGEQGRPA